MHCNVGKGDRDGRPNSLPANLSRGRRRSRRVSAHRTTTHFNCCSNVTSRLDPFTALKVAFPDSSRASLVNITDLLDSTFASAGTAINPAAVKNKTRREIFVFQRRAPSEPCHIVPPTLLVSLGRFKVRENNSLTPVNFGRTL